MAENSKIEWTTHTFNPWRGCQKVSAGCANCYADTLSHRNPRTLGTWGSQAQGGTRVVAAEAYWREPLKWNEAAASEISNHKSEIPRPRVFCASLADVFESWDGFVHNHTGEILWVGRIPLTLAQVRALLFKLIDATPHLDWLLLTKRPENIRRMWHGGAPGNVGPPPRFRPNVWLLTSIEDQPTADQRIPELLNCRDLAPVLGLSAEPLLGPIILPTAYCLLATGRWLIAGGESGPGARPMHPDWARSLRDQCTAAAIPFFFKQWGEYKPFEGDWGDIYEHPDGEHRYAVFPYGASPIVNYYNTPQTLTHNASAVMMERVGKKKAGRLLDGREHNEFPLTTKNTKTAKDSSCPS